MFKTIVWATDGSHNADRALRYAKVLAQQGGAALIVAHVVERYASQGGLVVHADEERVAAKLKDVTSELSSAGFDVRLEIAGHVGPQPAHAIADLAREADADMIVVGCRGHAAIAGLMLGSVTQRLLHVSPCPVLVIPPAQLLAQVLPGE